MKKRFEYTPDPTTGDTALVLEPNEVFVFAANQLGAHAGGSANAANKFYGAVWGEIHRTGRCYGLVTIYYERLTRMTIEELTEEFRLFLAATTLEPEKLFYLTKIGTGIAGWKLEDVLSAFHKHYMPHVHTNIVLPSIKFKNR